LKSDVARTSFTHCSPDGAVHNLTVPFSFKGLFLSICSAQNLYNSQNGNAVHPVRLCFDTEKQELALRELCWCLSPWSRFLFSWHLLLLDESHQLRWQRNHCKNISSMED